MRIQFLFLAIITGFLLTGCGAGVFAQKNVAPPFGIDKRPQPSGTDLNFLLPKKVGAFERADLPAGIKAPADEDLNVEYRSGDDSVFFGFSLPDTEKDAFEAVKMTRQEAIQSKLNLQGEQYQIGKNPGFFKLDSFMSWSRGRYFFYAKADTPRALENFMKAFPY
jgi:hypothetical protein